MAGSEAPGPTPAGRAWRLAALHELAPLRGRPLLVAAPPELAAQVAAELRAVGLDPAPPWPPPATGWPP